MLPSVSAPTNVQGMMFIRNSTKLLGLSFPSSWPGVVPVALARPDARPGHPRLAAFRRARRG
jgi:hypothetical protein